MGDFFTKCSPDGLGVIIYANGDTYEGQLKSNQRHGYGRYIWGDSEHEYYGAVYVGEYQADLRNGEGTYVWPDGRTYVGPWVRDRREGARGVMTWPAGDKYTGPWRNDRKQGIGEYLVAKTNTTLRKEYDVGVKIRVNI